MTRLTVAVFLGLSLSAVHGWAPVPTPDQSQVLDVAENAWSFPAKDVQEKTPPSHDHHYFDGHGTESTRWGDHTAFVTPPATPAAFVADKLGDQECEHYYFDGIGDTLCWVSQSEQDDHYFDGHGTASTRWNDPLAHPTFVKPKTLQVSPSGLEEFYFDGIGQAAYWREPAKMTSKVVVNKAVEDHDYFDGYGTRMKWNDPLLHASLVTAKPLVTNPNVEDCAEFYYDVTGDALCWVASFEEETIKTKLIDHDFFDGISETLEWGKVVNSMSSPKKRVKVLASNAATDCETKYSDGLDEVCWGPWE